MMWSLTWIHTSLLVSDHGFLIPPRGPNRGTVHIAPPSADERAFSPDERAFSLSTKKGYPTPNRDSFANDPTAGRSRDPDPILVANVVGGTQT
uniref:Uncharacterized protein n=1 Tax=Lepeophtheirus salmonis TaxID=72036 RepID=A0A0K2VC02_LEPSM